MIIMNLHGMLGNQLFQYAYAKQLAEENQAEFVLNTAFLPPDGYRLGFINSAIQTKNFGKNLPYWLCNAHTKYRSKAESWGNIHFQTKRERRFIKVGKRGNVILDGYWQGFQYIDRVGPRIREEVNSSLYVIGSKACCQMYDRIRSEPNSVMLHVRKGDYLASEGARNLYCQIGAGYYQKAISFIRSEYPNATFFIFTNDAEWVKDYIALDDGMTMVNCDASDVETLKLMSACKHSIIANSTFSWWGAYLSQSVEKTVVVPERWFCNEDDNPHNMYDETWVRM